MRNGMPEGPMNGEPIEPVREIKGCEKEWYPPKNELLVENEINIRFHSVGCVISVGCKSVAFHTVEGAMLALNEYVENPQDSKKKWMNIFNENK
jgi:hypothetical protein